MRTASRVFLTCSRRSLPDVVRGSDPGVTNTTSAGTTPHCEATRCTSSVRAPASSAPRNSAVMTSPGRAESAPAPTATPEELKDEMATRAERMRQSGRDPHTDRHGRVYTHISTPNVSNTIHGVYLTLDATGLLDDIPPALDLFGTKEVEREWVSLQNLEVLDVAENAWLNNINLVAAIGSEPTVLTTTGAPTNLYWGPEEERVRHRPTAPKQKPKSQPTE